MRTAGTFPAPPCNSPNVRDTDGAEGYVHVHAGIHGIASLAAATLIPSEHDWRNPVASIKLERIR